MLNNLKTLQEIEININSYRANFQGKNEMIIKVNRISEEIREGIRITHSPNQWNLKHGWNLYVNALCELHSLP